MAKISEPPKSQPPMELQTCLTCGNEEGPDVPGATFTANGTNGMMLRFWMCNPCAIKLGPDQGPITLEDPSTRV